MNIHDQKDQAFFRAAMARSLRDGDQAAAGRWAERLSELIYMRQAARDASMLSVTVAADTYSCTHTYQRPAAQITPGAKRDTTAVDK